MRFVTRFIIQCEFHIIHYPLTEIIIWFKQHIVFLLFNTKMLSTKQYFDIHALSSENTENAHTNSDKQTKSPQIHRK